MIEVPSTQYILNNVSTDHATIKTWKLTKNDLEKPGVGPLGESGDPEMSYNMCLIGCHTKYCDSGQKRISHLLGEFGHKGS